MLSCKKSNHSLKIQSLQQEIEQHIGKPLSNKQ